MIFYDIETTDLVFSESSGAEIIKIEAIKCADNAIIGHFSTFVRCKKPLKKAAVELTGITDETIANAPDGEKALSDFIDFVGDDAVVGYRVESDLAIIGSYGERYAEFFKNKLTDLFPIVKEKFGETIKNYRFKDRLDEIRFEITGKTEKKPNALTLENVSKYFGIEEDLSYPEKLFFIYNGIRQVS